MRFSFFFSSRRRHTRCLSDWSSDVCSSDLDLQFSRSTVTSIDWKTYPILTFPDVPEVVIDLIDRPSEKPWGAGEPTAAVVPSAISNAVYDAIGEIGRASCRGRE